MHGPTHDLKEIELLRTLPDLLPVRRDLLEDAGIKLVNRAAIICRNYLSPNRREFYKIVFINEGAGDFTLGLNTYHIEEPTLLFVHPNEIISWRNLAPNQAATGHFCFFRKSFLDASGTFRMLVDKMGLFTVPGRSVIRLKPDEVSTIDTIFVQMHQEDASGNPYTLEALQAYLQLLLIRCSGMTHHPEPAAVSAEYKPLHDFFQLLEAETAAINYAQPIKIKTAAEFADRLGFHPNYLNALLKKHTGQNISTHIRNRLLEESKILLLQTDWTLQEIACAVGFAEQPNFSQFFKKNTGTTPADFRRNYKRL